ncbi:uncharacterized protein VTP21DRAFT_7077 [Calcarisporiella thermophila]|uniref:uncharacterized protein n=1 Tax=Calcarisporiella thermophila TaxID=911321 RepID=UPI0037439A16
MFNDTTQRPFDTHQLSVYLSQHYYSSLDPIIDKTASQVATMFREAISLNANPLDSRVDVGILQAQIEAGINAHVKDQVISTLMAHNSLHEMLSPTALETTIHAFCQSPIQHQCLHEKAANIMTVLDAQFASHTQKFPIRMEKKLIPVLWRGVKRDVKTVVRELGEVKVEFRNEGEWKKLNKAEAVHGGSEVLRRFVKMVEDRL